MNKDLDEKPPNIPPHIWEAFKIRRIAERRQITRDELHKPGNVSE